MTRRTALSGAALLGLGAGLDRVVEVASGGGSGAGTVPFHGAHQAGIATTPQRYLSFASFDAVDRSPRALRELLQEWTAAARALTAGREYPGTDTGEAVDLPAARLTLTFGFGPGLFAGGSLATRKPELLEPLPPFAGDALESARSGGDLCVQACADDPQVTFHAVHLLALIAGSAATVRWLQHGFRGIPSGGATIRNLLGFKDGTDNIRTADSAAMNRYVWARQPAWMRRGTYLIARRIEIVFSGWDDLSLRDQERAIGRYKRSGAPLGGHHEYDRVDLHATDSHGNPLIPLEAHVRVANPATNGGQRILRRGYSYSTGATPGALDHGGHQVDGGLFFIAFVRDPARQLIPLLRRVATRDAMSTFTVHTASAIFACPPGAAAGGYVGQGLFE